MSTYDPLNEEQLLDEMVEDLPWYLNIAIWIVTHIIAYSVLIACISSAATVVIIQYFEL